MACQAHETDGYQTLGRDLGIGVRGWDRRMHVVSMRAAMVSGLRRTSLWLLRLRIADPSPASQAADTTSPVYDRNTLALLGFVTQARRLGFRLDEIKRIVALKRPGQAPWSHVLDLVLRVARAATGRAAEQKHRMPK